MGNNTDVHWSDPLTLELLSKKGIFSTGMLLRLWL